MRRNADAHQRKIMAERVAQYTPAQRKLWRKLERKLLAAGGDIVIAHPSGFDPDTEVLVEHGEMLVGPPVCVRKGRSSDCHGNASRLWKKDPKRYSIVTGYALVDGRHGQWIQHSWVVDRKKRCFVDWLDAKDAYYGYMLSDEYAARFHDANT